ncbi:MAG TPA: EF-P lysine aminoacylase EpmA [Deferrisomatales bacterium]|nr:EF-P lysine aminoacylase EpmA [Deferrisomatales bacterium]
MHRNRFANLHTRARILQGIRAFFVSRGYLEVETPHRIPAPAPEAHIDAPPAGEWFLHPSPELCMKRLLAAGHERIFQLCRCFRDGERGRLHLPEFTLLEWYRAGVDYTHLMTECEALLPALAALVGVGAELRRGGVSVALPPPWPRVTVAEAFREAAGAEVAEVLAADEFDPVLVERVEPWLAGLGKPVFLTEYPVALGALARTKPGDPSVAERFELYAGGLELANAFSELTDAAEQRRRFGAEAARRAAAGGPAYPSPEPFLRDLATMPEAAGSALGVDRLVMLLTGAEHIDPVVAFTPEEL